MHKILVVDDFEEHRRFVCSTLQRAIKCQTSEVADGLTALKKAQQERPDLVLLDIGLPGLNGIEAGRRIREVSPDSKILYLSQESSTDVVQEALRLGALGYILKADMADELLIAVNTVLQGRPFVGHRFATLGVGDTIQTRPDHHPLPFPQDRHHTDSFHEVASYRDEASFIESFACFIEKALRAGNPVVLIVSESHRRCLLNELQGRGLDIAAAVREGRYIALDAKETLAAYMVDGWPDLTRFANVARSVVNEAKIAKLKHSKVAVCGEGTAMLLAEGNAEAAIEVEHLWDDFVRQFGLQVLCGYILSDFQVKEDSHIFERIRAEHSAAYSH